MAKENLTDAERLEALRDELTEIASGIRSAQWAFLDSSDMANTAYLVACTLGRLGWMTDQACVLAGDEVPPVVGDAEAWMRHPSEEDRERREAGR